MTASTAQTGIIASKRQTGIISSRRHKIISRRKIGMTASTGRQA
jgi:hypothetical protein